MKKKIFSIKYNLFCQVTGRYLLGVTQSISNLNKGLGIGRREGIKYKQIWSINKSSRPEVFRKKVF